MDRDGFRSDPAGPAKVLITGERGVGGRRGVAPDRVEVLRMPARRRVGGRLSFQLHGLVQEHDSRPGCECGGSRPAIGFRRGAIVRHGTDW